MTLQEKFGEEVSYAAETYDINYGASQCVDICGDVATDFLEWYLSEEDDKEFQPKSVQELYEQFKIQKGL